MKAMWCQTRLQFASSDSLLVRLRDRPLVPPAVFFLQELRSSAHIFVSASRRRCRALRGPPAVSEHENHVQTRPRLKSGPEQDFSAVRSSECDKASRQNLFSN